MLSLSEAAAKAGVSVLTMWLAMKFGFVSATRTVTGDYNTSPEELRRAFGPYDPIATWLRRAVF